MEGEDDVSALVLGQVTMVVMGVLAHSEESLAAALAAPALLLETCPLGVSVLAAAVYALWPDAVRALLAAGASRLGDPVGMLSAAVADLSERGEGEARCETRGRAAALEIATLLQEL